MQPTPRHRAAEFRFRQLIDTADLDQPDNVEYSRESLVFRWEAKKVAVIVELDDPQTDCHAFASSAASSPSREPGCGVHVPCRTV
jgi:hypothetical protein